MKRWQKFAMLGTVLALAVAAGACQEDRRPDMDKTLNEGGLQSKDLRGMTDKVAPDLLAIPQIAGNPNQVTIVVTGMENHLDGNQARNLDIYVQRLYGLLASSSARGKIAFVENNATFSRIQAQELGTPDPFGQAGRTPAAPDARLQPQYALYGKMYSMHDRKDTYYLCQFQLTDLQTRQVIWGPTNYEVRTLN